MRSCHASSSKSVFRGALTWLSCHWAVFIKNSRDVKSDFSIVLHICLVPRKKGYFLKFCLLSLSYTHRATDKGPVVVVLDTSKPLGSSLTHGLHWRSRAVFWKQGGRQQSPLWRLQVGHGSSSNSAFRFFAYFQYAVQTLIDERFDSGRTIMWRGRLIDWLSEQTYT